MTFELTDAQQAARAAARTLAERVLAEAAEIDRTGIVPHDLAREAVALLSGAADLLSGTIVVETLATASAAVAVAAATERKGARGEPLDLPGLRGAVAIDASPRGQLTLAAVALGLATAASDAALNDLRQAAATPGKATDKPHWVVADVATDIEAARLLTYKAAAAHGGSEADIAVARLLATAAAERAVDAALRVIGVDAYRPGSVLERLARDVRALALVGGNEDKLRAVAADGLLPG